MSQDFVNNLYLPLWVLVAGSLCVFLLQTYHKRETIRTVLLAEINSLMRNMEQAKEYLDSDKHYWLQEGANINTAPLDTMPPPRFYNSAVPDLYLLTKREVEGVFEFYQQYEKTENLKCNLFLRIREYANTQKPLDSAAISRLQIEKRRVVDNYNTMLSSINSPIADLRSLPSSYAVEKTASVAQKIDRLSSTST